MSTEFGIFNDEGCVEGSFFSREEAVRAAGERYAEDFAAGDVHVAECCHDHPEEEREGCRECPVDDAEDEPVACTCSGAETGCAHAYWCPCAEEASS